MKTTATKKLNFKKNVITELNENTLNNVRGGSDVEHKEQLPPFSRYTSWLCNGVN